MNNDYSSWFYSSLHKRAWGQVATNNSFLLVFCFYVCNCNWIWFRQRIARPFSNWARSYHNRLSKKWATILSRSFSQKVSQIRSWNFTIWSGSFPIIFKEYQKEQFRIYLNKAQNLEKNILFFLKKYILRFGFIKKI